MEKLPKEDRPEEENNFNLIKEEQKENKNKYENNKYDYKNKGILLIFNKLVIRYNYCIKKETNNKLEENILKPENLSVLREEIEKTTFDEIIKEQNPNDAISSIIKDYYLYFITRNESLERETNDLGNICKLLEMICEFQFNFKKKKNLEVDDLLSLIIWTNNYYLELHELLYCIEYFKLENIFKKKNIYNEILKRKPNQIEFENDEQKELIGLKIGLEVILSFFNDKCLEEPKEISKIIEIIPNLYNIEERYNLNCKEIYFLIEIKYIYLLINNKENYNENLIRQLLKNYLIPCRYLYKENSEREGLYKELISHLIPDIKKDENDKFRYIIKILVQEYKKCQKDNTILDTLIKILDENKSLLKVSQLLFHEILSSNYFKGTEIIFDKIKDYKTEDHFLKLISSYQTSDNYLYLEQILLEVFESKFNAHFTSYLNEINNTIKYEDLTNEQAEQLLKGKNLENFKECIKLLEDTNIRESKERFLPNIVYCAYIKSYFYQFISYVFKKANQPIDIQDIVNIINEDNEKEFKNKERKVMEIYSFRILFEYLNKDFNNLKNYNFDEKGLVYKKLFEGDDTFDDQIPKIIEFCSRTIEDYINSDDQECTPKGMESINILTNSFLSIKIVSLAIYENSISIDSNQYKEIWDYFKKHLLSKKIFITYNNNDIFMNYYLLEIIIKELKNKLNNNSFGLGSFQNNQNLSNLNNKTLGIIIYIIRFCLHSYSILEENKSSYFYSKLIDYESNENIDDYIKSCFIPGRLNQEQGIQRVDLNTFIMGNEDHNKTIINENEEPKMEIISILMMRFLFYSHLFFRNLLGKLSDSTFSNIYSITDGYSCLRMIISIWSKLDSDDIIPGTETNKVEIFLNRVIKEISSQYILCQNFDNKENVNNFENSFNKYIIKCREEYKYYKLNYIDKTMKAIIQQNNFPLSYEKNDYPFMKYFVLTNNPNIEDLKLKIKDNIEEKKLYLTDTIINYDETLKVQKYDDFIKNNQMNKIHLFLSNLFSLSPQVYKDSDIILGYQNNVLIEKYNEYFSDYNNKKFSEVSTKMDAFTNNLIDSSMKFLKKYISKLKEKNYYIYKNLRRPLLSQSSIHSESIIFDLSKISKYKSYPHLLSKYIYKDIFMEESEKISDYIDVKKIKIDYNRYKEFDIDVEAFEDELTSIIIPNKRLFYDNDYNKKIIYSFDTFRGQNNNLLNTFIIKYQNCFEEIDLENKEIIKKAIIEPKKEFINIFIEKLFIRIEDILKLKNSEDKKEEPDFLMKYAIDNCFNKSKNEIIQKYTENINEEILKKVRFDFVINVYFNLLKIINYLAYNIISGDISLNEIITNLPDIYNISDYSKIFYKNNQGFKLKHLYSIFEEFEKYLFPYILLHVYDKYKIEMFDENKDNIINYFEINKDNIKETKFTKRQLIDALRKFISRYLTSSDINNEYNNKNEDGEDLPTHISLINYLNKSDLWPLEVFYNEDKIEYGFNNLKDFNLLVKHSYDLYKCLSGISFDNKGNIEKKENNDIKVSETESEYNFYKDIVYFNNKIEITKKLSINSFYNNAEYFKEYFKFYNLGNIYFEYINTNNQSQDISVLGISNSNNGLYCSSWKVNLENESNIFDCFKKENSVLFNNDNLQDINYLTCLKMLKDNEIYCFGTNNGKFKIFKFIENYTKVELVQDIKIKDDSSCINNIVEYNNNKTLITSDEKHILVFEKNEDDNNFNTYTEKKDIALDNKAYIIKVDEHNLAALIYSNNLLKFYTIDNYEFAEIVVNEIKCEINSSNQKQYKIMGLIGSENNVLGICSNEHSIYLIDINEKKLIKNCTFEGYENNYVSISKFYDDYVLLLDSTNNFILAQIQKNEAKVEDLKFVKLFKKLNSDLNSLNIFPYGFNHFYYDGNDIICKYNEFY